MKKYFLSLLIVPLLLIGGYSSASEIECNNTCDINTSNKQGCFLEINSCNGSEGTFALQAYNDVGDGIQNFEYDDCEGKSLEIQEGYVGVYVYNYSDKGFMLDYDINCGTEEENGTILPNGTSNFTPIITGLTNSINEFIPYVVYIGLGVLGVLISFVAIKRLINWVRRKIFSSFK